MKLISQHKRHPNGNGFACAFEGPDAGMRKKMVNKLFRDSINETLRDSSKLREYIGDIEDGCPHACKSISRNEVTLTAYVFQNGTLGMHLDCSEHSCERNRLNYAFSHSSCMDEPILIAPLKLDNAAIKEQRGMKREAKSSSLKPETGVS